MLHKFIALATLETSVWGFLSLSDTVTPFFRGAPVHIQLGDPTTPPTTKVCRFIKKNAAQNFS